MEWLIPVTLTAPLRVQDLSARRDDYPLRLRLRPCCFRIATGPALTDHPLDMALASLGFAADRHVPTSEVLHGTVAAPWRVVPLPDNTEILRRTALLDSALELGLLERPAPPARLTPLEARLQAIPHLPALVREALAFALLDNHVRWDNRSRLLDDWQRARRVVLFDRDRLGAVRAPVAPELLVQGYGLLSCIDALAQEPATVARLESAWDAFTRQYPEPPLALALAFWGEGTYRLSEQGDMQDAALSLERMRQAADALVQRLPGLAGELDVGMWWHHLGRLAYYQGKFDEALPLYVREWLFRERLDGVRQARLARNLSSLLNDMGYLQKAEELIQPALDWQVAEHDREVFKTWGRLGEIQLRQGHLTEARAALDNSLKAQPDRRGSQTDIYRGHAALLADDLDAAQGHYQAAQAQDERDGVVSNPYLRMGEAALALRRRAVDDLELLWEIYGPELRHQQGLRALPVAVLVTARFVAAQTDAAELREWVSRLVAASYVGEVLYPASLAYPDPAAMDLLPRIESTLRTWQKTCQQVSAQLPLGAAPPPVPTPDNLLEALARCRAENDWEALRPFRPGLYPFNLLESPTMGVS